MEELHIAKPESKEVIDYLKNTLKMRVAMITGDNKHAAMKVARYLDIDA
jgi:cation transport ATPase